MNSVYDGVRPRFRKRGASRNHVSQSPMLPLDAILPLQFFPARRGGNRIEGVKRLMCAVLDDALRCFEGNLTARSILKRRLFLEAEFWLFKEKGATNPFSFENLCQAVGIEPARFRRALRARRARLLIGETPDRLSRRSRVGPKWSSGARPKARCHRAERQTSGRKE